MVRRQRSEDHPTVDEHRRRTEGGTIMQVDALSNDDLQTGKTMKRAMSLLAAVAFAAAAGLATIDVAESDLTPRALKTDANEQGVRSSTAPEAPAVPARGELDPALQRPDRGNDHHG